MVGLDAILKTNAYFGIQTTGGSGGGVTVLQAVSEAYISAYFSPTGAQASRLNTVKLYRGTADDVGVLVPNSSFSGQIVEAYLEDLLPGEILRIVANVSVSVTSGGAGMKITYSI